MNAGPSKYQQDARELRQKYSADGVFVVVIGGTSGDGACGDFPAEQVKHGILRRIARALRMVADAVERGTPDGAGVYAEERKERRN